MKIHNPFYIAFALALTTYVGVANHNGWSLVRTVANHALHHAGPSTQHK